MSIFAFTIYATEPVVAFSIGPLNIHWYGLAYLFAFLGAWRYGIYLGKLSPRHFDKSVFDDLLFWTVLGGILGGRLGFVFFYNWDYYLRNPLEILYTWQGGMSIHGGIIGAMLTIFYYTYREKFSFWQITDCITPGVPIGLFLGRLANFANGELYGRVTDSSFGVVFASGGPFMRHPSQLYEAFLEGLVLFVLLFFASRCEKVRTKTGMISGIFAVFYALFRIIVEFFREPDPQIGYILDHFTMGQILSLPILLLGLYLVLRPTPKKEPSGSKNEPPSFKK
jgi:phosphatidylglycerol:prolipoprotein diacylglycerol transferase